jgi:hypothetical protein
MPVPASVENYTVPGGVKLWFDAGAGDGIWGITEVDMRGGEAGALQQPLGKRLKDKVIVRKRTDDQVQFDEPVIENLKYYFKGGNIENLSPGTGGAVGAGSGRHSPALGSQYYGLTNVTVRQFLDRSSFTTAQPLWTTRRKRTPKRGRPLMP